MHGIKLCYLCESLHGHIILCHTNFNHAMFFPIVAHPSESRGHVEKQRAKDRVNFSATHGSSKVYT